MTTYLQLNGTGDQLFSANVTWTKVVMDCVVNYTSSLATTEKPIINGSTATPYPRINAIAKNSTTYTAHTNSVNAFINGTTLGYGGDISLGTRETFEMDLNSASYPTLTTQIGFFTDKNNNYCIPADIYDIKIYNGATLIAHYDMSTGTVNDQTGNGYNATLTGGTWVTSGTSGTPESVSFDTKLRIHAQETVTFDSKQEIYTTESVSFGTKQSIYIQETLSFDTKQIVYIHESTKFDAKQVVYMLETTSFDMTQRIYATETVNFDTKQRVYTVESISFDTKQKIDSASSFEIVIFDTKQALYASESVKIPTRQQIRDRFYYVTTIGR